MGGIHIEIFTKKGTEFIGEVVNANLQVKEANEYASTVVNTLKDASDSISSIVDIIESIAEESKKTTKSIGDAVTLIQTEAQNAVRAIIDGSEKSNISLQKAENAKDEFANILEKVIEIANSVDRIIEDQVASFQEITASLEDLKNRTIDLKDLSDKFKV